MKRSVCALLAAVPLFLAGAMNPFQFGPRAEIMIPDEAKDWECAIADSTDLSKLPENLQWMPGNRGKNIKTAMIGGHKRYTFPLFDKNNEFIQKTELTKWHRRIVEVPEDYLKNHAAFFSIATARLKFGLIVNGKYVGSSYQACLAKEMEVTKYLRPGKNEIAFAITAHEGLVDPRTKEWYAPHYTYADGARFKGPIKLEFRPYCFVDDVFVKTSVKNREIEFEITLKNTLNKPVDVVPYVRVVPEQDLRRPRMEFSSEAETVPAKGEKIIHIRKNWTGPLLLWDMAESGNHQYIAQVNLSERGVQGDQYFQKFGFRDVTVSGRDILLNGKRIFLSRDSIMGCSADFEKWGYHRWYKGKNAVNATRMHLGSLPYWIIDSCDRNGRILIPELAYSFFNEDNRFKKEGVEEYCKGVAKFYRNHPSVLMYSLTNETVWNDTDKKWKEVTEHYLQTMRKYAPNALLQADADNTWNGLLDINNIHYPEGSGGTLRVKYPNSGFTIPNDLWWVTKENGAPNGGWRTNPFQWDKPVIIGEFYGFTNPAIAGDEYYNHLYWKTEPPFIGHINYYTPATRNSSEETMRIMCNYYRYVGFAGLNPWTGDYNYVLEHTVIAPLEFQPNQTAGGKLERKIAFFNDGGCPVNKITWVLKTEDYSIIKQGEWTVSVPQGEKWDGIIRVDLPKRNEPYPVSLSAFAFMNTNEQARMEQKIYVMPGKYDLSFLSGKVAVIGNSFDSKLTALNLKSIHHVQENKIPNGIKVLIVAPDAFHISMRTMLDTFLQSGGTVLMMSQKNWIPYRADLPERDLYHAATQSWFRIAEHPIFSGLTEEQMKFWGKDNIVSKETFQKPFEGSFRNLLECGGILGMAWTPLVEVDIGNGVCILNSFVSENSDPVLLKLYANMIRYGVERKPENRIPLCVAVGSNLKIQPLLNRIFVQTEPEISPSSKLLLVDASAGIAPAELEKILERGGTVWLHGYTGDSLKKLGKLIPDTVRMVPRPKEILGGMPIGKSSLTKGISNFDLAWYLPPMNKERWRFGNYWKQSVKTAEPSAWCFEINDPSGNARKLTDPGFLAEIKYGNGRILLDLLPWETAVEKESGKVMRTVAMLCRNLGAQFKRVVKPHYEYRKVDLASFANMGYWDTTENDGKGGWTDQGRNDMRMFLINHVGRNDYEENGQITPTPDFPEENIFCGVPYHLTAPKKNQGKAILSFGTSSPHTKLMREVKKIPLKDKADCFWVLHAAAWMTEKRGTPIAEYILKYEDGSQIKIPVRAGIDICDWWLPVPSENCQVAWSGNNKKGAVNLYASCFKNPNPEKTIDSLCIRAGLTGTQYVVLGITLGMETDAVAYWEPVSKLKLDFEHARKAITLKEEPRINAPEKKTDGVHFKKGNELRYTAPFWMNSFMDKPSEIEFEFTPKAYPSTYRGMIFSLGTMSVNIRGKVLEIAGKTADGKWGFIHSKIPLELGVRTKINVRFERQSASIFRNGRLEHRAPYELAPMKIGAILFGKSSGDACDLNGILHRIEFFELVPEKTE